MNPNADDAFRRLMVLKYLISHSYRSIPSQYAKEVIDSWTDAEREHFEREVEKETTFIISSMKSFDVWDNATQSEKDFISALGSKIDIESLVKASWKMEAAVTLMWALNLLNKFPDIDEQASPELLKIVEIKKLELISNGFTLRPHDEIDKVRRIMELWHWRVNTRRLIEDNYDFHPDDNMKQNGINHLDDIVKRTAKTANSNGDIMKIIDEDFVFKGRAFRDLNNDEFNEATSIIIERHYALNWLCGYAPNNNWDETPTDT